MESHRVVGDLRTAGAPRRLVDLLNSIDTGVLNLRHCRLDDPLAGDASAEPLEAVQIARDSVLFVMPRGDSGRGDPFEVVRKKPVPATIVVPGYAISGNVFLLPDADPPTFPLIGNHHFFPLTEVTIVGTGADTAIRREPLVVVNMTRAVAYGPKA